MPAAKGMSHMIPNHVLRVGQTICLDPSKEKTLKEPNRDHDDLDISLDNLNQLMLDLDPTFEPVQVNNKSPSCISPPTDDSSSDEDITLVSRGCHPFYSPSVAPCVSPSIAIPSPNGVSYSPQGALVFSSSPTSSLPPLPGGSVHRRNPTPRQETGCSRLSLSNRNSVASLLSMSTCSDTSYILGSTLSLTSEDADFTESPLYHTSSSFGDGSRMRSTDNMLSPEKPPLLRRSHLQEQYGTHSSPASLSGSLTDIPVLLVNGTPQRDMGIMSLGPDIDLTQTLTTSNARPLTPQSYQARFSGSQPSMKFVMDTSKFWFRPHITRAEAEAQLKDKEPGAFVVRDSTSYRGSFGLAMKVDQTSANSNVGAYPGENSSELIRHFLIESSAKGVRVKGSSQEPYFGVGGQWRADTLHHFKVCSDRNRVFIRSEGGSLLFPIRSLSALIFQHTISAYALPCKLALQSQDINVADDRTYEKIEADDKKKTASNFIYLNAVPTEMLTGPCAVQKAVSCTFGKAPGSFTPTVVNLKVSLKGVTLTDINRKLFFRRHYPAHLLSYSGEDPDNRLWHRGSSFGARMFGFVAKGVEAGMENVCHVFAEYDPLQPCNEAIDVIQAAIAKL